MTDYAAGSTVYGSGSSAATSGTVDPLGYIERELAKRRQAMAGGSDGESDTRSGLAASSLQTTGNGADATPETMQTLGAPTTPISSSPTGALQYPQLKLPFDLELSQQRNQFLQQFQQEEQQNQTALQGAARRKVQSQRQLDENIPIAFRQLLNGFTGRGMAFSSGYGTGVTNTNRDIQNQQAGIDTDYTEAKNQSLANHNISQQNFLAALNALALEQSQRAKTKAGKLKLDPNYKDPADIGYGKDSTKLKYRGAYKAAAKKKLESREHFLKTHPNLAATKPHSHARKVFLKKHPHVAAELRTLPKRKKK